MWNSHNENVVATRIFLHYISVQKLLTKEHSRLIKHINCEQMEQQEYNPKIYKIYKIKKIHKIK
jgi:hypothetical protein